ncbi:CsbD family protein [Phenylobacterium sp.]|uniref:CsbD family protein n=1 Tax=Phenylobacterium sp. TaxID=1871053 RepID=UPI0012004D9B|nr:CsbD family protein [Phenylobacterium sp.]THD63910.1 MAG: CsbD family protein [Phenylobacterium sp.]
MTDERIEGVLREGVGHVQDAVGGLTGDAKTQAKGKLNQAAGAMQDTYGQLSNAVTDNLEDAFDEIQSFVKARPFAAVGIGVGLGLLAGLIVARSRD